MIIWRFDCLFLYLIFNHLWQNCTCQYYFYFVKIFLQKKYFVNYELLKGHFRLNIKIDKHSYVKSLSVVSLSVSVELGHECYPRRTKCVTIVTVPKLLLIIVILMQIVIYKNKLTQCVLPKYECKLWYCIIQMCRYVKL